MSDELSTKRLVLSWTWCVSAELVDIVAQMDTNKSSLNNTDRA